MRSVEQMYAAIDLHRHEEFLSKPKKVKKGWNVVVHGSPKSEWEISACHTNHEHGYISWGWDGAQKYVIGVSRGRGDYRLYLFNLHKRMAQTMCDFLNEENPDGV